MLRKTVTVTTNDPESRTVRLTVQADIVPEVLIDPRVVQLGEIEPGAKVEREVRVSFRQDAPGAKDAPGRSGPGAPRRVTGVEATGPVRAEIVPGGDGEVTRVRVALAPPAPIGRLRGVVTIRTDDGKAHRVSVHGEVAGDLEIDPRFVRLSPGGEATVQVRRRAGRAGPPFRVTGADAPDRVRARVVEVARGESYQVRLAVEPDAGRVQGRLTIRTSHASHPEIDVPIVYLSRPAVRPRM